MSQALFSDKHMSIPASRADTPSSNFGYLSSSNIRVLPLTNKRWQPPLRLVKTYSRGRDNSAFDVNGAQGMSGFHEFELSVRDYELDQYGVVNNAVFANYCQHARRLLLKKIGIDVDTIAESGNAIAVTELSLKYIAPLRIGDRFIVRVRVSESSSARVYFEHFIYKIPNKEPILEARATQVWLDKNYRPIGIPADVKAKLMQLLSHKDSNGCIVSYV